MGASFRNKEQVLELAVRLHYFLIHFFDLLFTLHFPKKGCDLLTVSPGLLAEIQGMDSEVPRKLDASCKSDIAKVVLSESAYRWEMCNDECAHFKLAEGIRK